MRAWKERMNGIVVILEEGSEKQKMEKWQTRHLIWCAITGESEERKGLKERAAGGGPGGGDRRYL